MSTCNCFDPELHHATGRCAHCGNVIPPRTPASGPPLDVTQPDRPQPVGDATTVRRDSLFIKHHHFAIDSMPAVSPDPLGKLVLTHHTCGHDRWITVKHADPEVRFTHEMLTNISNKAEPNINNGTLHHDMRMDPVEHQHDTCTCPPGLQCFTGWILHIDGRDRQVVYQIGEWVPGHGPFTWIARWPD